MWTQRSTSNCPQGGPQTNKQGRWRYGNLFYYTYQTIFLFFAFVITSPALSKTRE